MPLVVPIAGDVDPGLIPQSTMVQRVRDILGDNPWAESFTANLASDTSGSVTVPDGTLWDKGAIGEWQDNGEQFYVRSISSNTLTVFRGYNSTQSSLHNGSVTPIVLLRDPVFTYKRIVDSINLIAHSLWPYVWKKVTTTLTPSAGVSWYALGASDARALIDVNQVDTTPTDPRYYLYNGAGTRRPCHLILNAPPDISSTGVALHFPQGMFSSTLTVNVDYAAQITDTVTAGNYADWTDGVIADCITHGAAARLVSALEVPRTTQQDTSMGDSTVPVGGRSNAGQGLWANHLRLRAIAHEELRRTMPFYVRGRGPMTSGGLVSPPYA